MSGEILRRASDLEERGEAYALATVVRVDRPVSSKPGDRAIISRDGRLEGWIGGSCAEPVVVREALSALTEETSRLVRIRPIGSAREPAQPGVVTEITTCASDGGLDVFVEPRLPAARLVVAGSSPTARTLVALAKVFGYRVTAALEAPDERLPGADTTVAVEDLSASALVPEDAVVVATMSRYDEAALEAALQSDAGYIGFVASKPRGAHALDMLRSRGASQQQLARITTPAGIDLGPSTQEEIALSVLAEVVAHRHQAGAQPAEPLCPPGARDAVDPVCGMTIAVLPSALTQDHDGFTYYFCSRHCRDRFRAGPERFDVTMMGARKSRQAG